MRSSSGFAISGELPEFPFCAVFAIKPAPKVAASSLVTTVIPPENLTTQHEPSTHASPPPPVPPDDALTEQFYSFKDRCDSSSSPEFYNFKDNFRLSPSHSSASETLAQDDENLDGSEFLKQQSDVSSSDGNSVHLTATQHEDTITVTENGPNNEDRIAVAGNDLSSQDQSILHDTEEAASVSTGEKVKTKKKKKKKFKFRRLKEMGNRLCALMRAIGICLTRCSPCSMAFGDDQASSTSICDASGEYTSQFVRQVIENNSLLGQTLFD